jgi:hypothetical protein
MSKDIVDYYKKKLAKVNEAFVNKLRTEGSVNVMSNPVEVPDNDPFNFW